LYRYSVAHRAVAAAYAHFWEVDTDGDGVLSLEEMKVSIGKGVLDEEIIKSEFKVYDVDASGGISFQEMLGWLAGSANADVIFKSMPEVGGRRPSGLFAELNKEGPSDRPLLHCYQVLSLFSSSRHFVTSYISHSITFLAVKTRFN
jgi:hypothetical protein